MAIKRSLSAWEKACGHLCNTGKELHERRNSLLPEMEFRFGIGCKWTPFKGQKSTALLILMTYFSVLYEFIKQVYFGE